MEGKMNDVQTSPLIPKEIDVESTLEIGAKNHLKKRVAYQLYPVVFTNPY